MKITIAGYEIDAHSEGGIETCFQIPAFDVCLDIGRCPPGAEKQSRLLLTHAHMDHAAGLPYYVSLRSLLGMSPPTVYCPRGSRDILQSILDSWAKLQADSDRCQLIGVGPGDEIPLSSGFARVFTSPHRIEAVGYTIFRRIKRLKTELVGATSDEIARRSRAGEDVSIESLLPQICFPGDTTIEVVTSEPSLIEAKLLMLECTFVGPNVSPAKARRSGHVHLDDIALHADRLANQHILLTHFSRRHSRSEIEQALKEALPETLRQRITLLVHESRV